MRDKIQLGLTSSLVPSRFRVISVTPGDIATHWAVTSGGQQKKWIIFSSNPQNFIWLITVLKMIFRWMSVRWLVKRSHQVSDVCGHRMRNIRIRLLNLGFWGGGDFEREFHFKPQTFYGDKSFFIRWNTESREIDVNSKYHSLCKHSSIIRS